MLKKRGNKHFETYYSILIILFVFGLLIDTYFHFHAMSGSLETFFTPWHLILYSSSLFLGILLLYPAAKEYHQSKTKKFFSFFNMVPKGYKIALIGILLFYLGGIGDLLWHELIGIEIEISAIFSPSHLLVLISAFMVVSGPFLSAWGKSKDLNGWKDHFPMIISITAIIFVLFSFTIPFNPWTNQIALDSILIRDSLEVINIGAYDSSHWIRNTFESLGLASILIYSITLIMIILPMILKFRKLPTGSIFFILGVYLSIVSAGSHNYFLLPGALLAPLIIEGAKKVYGPSIESPKNTRIFSFLFGFIIFGVYMANVVLLNKTYYTIHMIIGTPFLAGAIAFLASLALTQKY